jgi:hypothetical protein
MPLLTDGLQPPVGSLHVIMLFYMQDLRMGYVKSVMNHHDLSDTIPETVGHPNPVSARS